MVFRTVPFRIETFRRPEPSTPNPEPATLQLVGGEPVQLCHWATSKPFRSSVTSSVVIWRTEVLALASAGPWGQGFPEPLFDNRFRLRDQRVIGEKHLKLRVQHQDGGPTLDAVAFAFRDSLEALKDAGTKVTRVTAVGGGSRSDLWLQIIATVLGVPVDLPAAGDVGGAFGAARLGLIAATGADFRKVLTAPKTARTIKPNPKAREAYEAQYRRYTQIYPAIKEIYR